MSLICEFWLFQNSCFFTWFTSVRIFSWSTISHGYGPFRRLGFFRLPFLVGFGLPDRILGSCGSPTKVSSSLVYIFRLNSRKTTLVSWCTSSFCQLKNLSTFVAIHPFEKLSSKYHQNVTIKLLLCQFNQTMNHYEQIR